jgi:hypothetical protein
VRTLRVDEKAMQQLQREYPVDFVGIVPISFEVTLYHGFKRISFEVRPGKSARVKEHFLNVFGEPVPVPDPKMVILVPAEEKALEMERRHKMIDLGRPLRHPVVIGVFGLKREIVVTAKHGAGKLFAAACESHVCPYVPQGQIPVTDQPNAEVIILGHRLRRPECGPNHIVIQEG